jgi:hypothetical protein
MSLILSLKDEKLESIARRREELIEKAARQRQRFGEIHRQMAQPLLWADRGWSLMRTLQQNPILVSLGAAALVKLIFRRNNAFTARSGFWPMLAKWSGRLFEAWGVIGQIRRLFSSPAASRR